MMSHDLVQVDETVTFTCKVTRVSGSSDSSISLLKGVLKVGGLPISEFIAQSGILRRPYVNLPRYSIDTKTEGNEITQTLTISGKPISSSQYCEIFWSLTPCSGTVFAHELWPGSVDSGTSMLKTYYSNFIARQLYAQSAWSTGRVNIGGQEVFLNNYLKQKFTVKN